MVINEANHCVSKVLKLECLLSFRHVHTSGSILIPPKVKDAVTLGGWVTEIKIQQLTEKSIIITISHDSNYSVSISNPLSHDPDILEYTFGSSLVLIIPSYPIPTHLIPFDPLPHIHLHTSVQQLLKVLVDFLLFALREYYTGTTLVGIIIIHTHPSSLLSFPTPTSTSSQQPSHHPDQRGVVCM